MSQIDVNKIDWLKKIAELSQVEKFQERLKKQHEVLQNKEKQRETSRILKQESDFISFIGKTFDKIKQNAWIKYVNSIYNNISHEEIDQILTLRPNMEDPEPEKAFEKAREEFIKRNSGFKEYLDKAFESAPEVIKDLQQLSDEYDKLPQEIRDKIVRGENLSRLGIQDKDYERYWSVIVDMKRRIITTSVMDAVCYIDSRYEDWWKELSNIF